MSENPTTEQLRFAIDCGRTGDKIPGFDPAAAPLGTDEEAAGTPPGSEARKLAYEIETGWPSHNPSRAGIGSVWLLIAFAIVFLAFAVVAMLARGPP
jgi:hypothetical protein